MMKLWIFVLLIPITTAVPGISSAQTWLAIFQQPLTCLIESSLRRSTVPQFIVDVKHPWVLENQHKLERLPNAEEFLCSDFSERKESTEVEAQTAEELKIPLDLFDYLEIDNNRAVTRLPAWSNALERLGEMKKCPRALKQVKVLQVDIYVHPHYSNLNHPEPPKPSKELLALFGDVLESMTNLETLKWTIRKEYTHLFEEAFKLRNLTLPFVKHLEPGPSSDYLVGMCPNLEILKNGGGTSWYDGYMPDNRNWGLRLIQAAASTPKLKLFSMVCGNDGWTTSLVSGMFSS